MSRFAKGMGFGRWAALVGVCLGGELAVAAVALVLVWRRRSWVWRVGVCGMVRGRLRVWRRGLALRLRRRRRLRLCPLGWSLLRWWSCLQRSLTLVFLRSVKSSGPPRLSFRPALPRGVRATSTSRLLVSRSLAWPSCRCQRPPSHLRPRRDLNQVLGCSQNRQSHRSASSSPLAPSAHPSLCSWSRADRQALLSPHYLQRVSVSLDLAAVCIPRDGGVM